MQNVFLFLYWIFFPNIKIGDRDRTLCPKHKLCDWMPKTKIKKQLFNKQVRVNIGLADTLIPSSFLYLIYMGGTGPCDLIKIIFGYHVNS